MFFLQYKNVGAACTEMDWVYPKCRIVRFALKILFQIIYRPRLKYVSACAMNVLFGA